MSRCKEIKTAILAEINADPDLYTDKSAAEVAILLNRGVSQSPPVYVEAAKEEVLQPLLGLDDEIKQQIIDLAVSSSIIEAVAIAPIEDELGKPIEDELGKPIEVQQEILVPFSEVKGFGIVSQGEVEEALNTKE